MTALHYATCQLAGAGARVLPRTLAEARDLGHSGPFMHNGVFGNLTAVLERYMAVSAEARTGEVRNADPRLPGIALTPADIENLLNFLVALDEDYS